ncbi:MAG: 50S ribosomal protein L1 [Candidatus Altiarchaeales archaeon IMC4]|nr:MAG: 50S ribosomal protein L1 [Candidatus Altiarchaeales archaeon IMC4]
MDTKEIQKRVEEALKGSSGKKKFKQSAELSINFNVSMNLPENKLNLNVVLPKGRGKDFEVGVFADGDMMLNAKKVSKHVLTKAEMEKMGKSKREMRNFSKQCYWFIAQADMMANIGKIWGVVLAPRGKMPQPAPPNVDVKPIIERLKKTVRVRSKKNPTVQVPVGTEDMPPSDIADNILAVINSIERQIHEDKIASVYFKTTMGPSVKLW